MAAVSITNRREVVMGSRRCVMGQVSFANNDTLATGIKVCSASVDSNSTTAVGLTYTYGGNSITFSAGGAITLAPILIWGY